MIIGYVSAYTSKEAMKKAKNLDDAMVIDKIILSKTDFNGFKRYTVYGHLRKRW